MDLIQIYQCLCEETRLRILHLLLRSPLGVSHLQQVLELPQVKVSKHLAYLREHGMVEAQRRENRVIYRLPAQPNPALDANLRCLQDCAAEQAVFKADAVRYRELAPALQDELAGAGGLAARIATPRRQVLFVCAANAARSVLAEFLLRRAGRGRFEVFSAGAKPSGKVNPYAVAVLREEYGVDATRAVTKSVDAFRDRPLDFVLTLCGSPEDAACPVWAGEPIRAHWPVPDPALATGGELQIYGEFRRAARLIERRLDFFCGLPFDSADRAKLESMTRDLGSLQPEPETVPAAASPR